LYKIIDARIMELKDTRNPEMRIGTLITVNKKTNREYSGGK
jgi:hypothetical protein